MQALRAFSAAETESHLQWLGPNLGPIFNCSHPHLLRLAPYEQYERYLLPEKIAVRAGEFKLYLAEYIDRAGLPAASLGALAEPVAMALFRGLHLTDFRDWRGVASAFASLNLQLVQQTMEKL